MKAANAAGEPVLGTAPSLARAGLIFSASSASLMSALSLLTMAGAVPAGATTPAQTLRVTSGKPSSSMVGICGIAVSGGRTDRHHGAVHDPGAGPASQAIQRHRAPSRTRRPH